MQFLPSCINVLPIRKTHSELSYQQIGKFVFHFVTKTINGFFSLIPIFFSNIDTNFVILTFFIFQPELLNQEVSQKDPRKMNRIVEEITGKRKLRFKLVSMSKKSKKKKTIHQIDETIVSTKDTADTSSDITLFEKKQ